MLKDLLKIDSLIVAAGAFIGACFLIAICGAALGLFLSAVGAVARWVMGV